MKKKNTFIEKILPDVLKSSIDLGLDRRSYGHFRLILFSIMITITMGPVFTIALLGYFNYKDLLQKDEHEQLEWQLDGSIRSIEQMVENLKSVVQFAARRDRYTELITGANLDELYARLKRQYSFFADLGVIDQHGIKRAYHGPYDLIGTDYSKEAWFKQVNDHGVHISRVYTGYRHVPHFAVSVSNFDPNARNTWVLRATIDAMTLQQFIDTIKTNASDDLFLIDEEGYLQTTSEFYGKTLSRSDIGMTMGVSHGVIESGENIFYAIGKIEKTPWSLVLVKKRYIHHEDWISFRNNLFLIAFACTIISVVVIYTLVTLLTSLIRRADEIQFSLMKEAEHTDKLASIGRLAAGVGHEINNPLAIIDQKTGLIEDLLMISPDFEHKETIKKSLASVNTSVERCKAITHRLLGFARRTDVFVEPLNVNEIIREVLQFLENSMVYSRIEVDLQLHDDLPQIVSDRMQLQQIFLNILNNAIDAIGKDGVITIFTHMIAGEVRVVIQDNGIGIEEEVLSQIFEPFFTTKETGKGTGLGLSITYGLIKKLGGDITVRSHVGKGTAFTITIPLHSEQDDREQ
jgi:two-component system NtrC family sensor kinase